MLTQTIDPQSEDREQIILHHFLVSDRKQLFSRYPFLLAYKWSHGPTGISFDLILGSGTSDGKLVAVKAKFFDHTTTNAATINYWKSQLTQVSGLFGCPYNKCHLRKSGQAFSTPLSPAQSILLTIFLCPVYHRRQPNERRKYLRLFCLTKTFGQQF